MTHPFWDDSLKKGCGSRPVNEDDIKDDTKRGKSWIMLMKGHFIVVNFV